MHFALDVLRSKPLNLLLVLAPLSWGIDRVWPDSPLLFIVAALALVPLAGLIGHGTEQLVHHTGPTLGGLLNATFGNAAELIIAFTALRSGHVELVKASITGSIVGNLLLVLGLSMFIGGLGRRRQRFNRTAAGNSAAMLFLGVAALVMPAVFDLTVYRSLTASSPVIDRMSFWTAIILMAAYASNLVYSFTWHQSLLHEGEGAVEKPLTMAQAVSVLAAGTVLTAVQSELLVGALNPALERFGMTELFVGVIVIAVIGNAAEHYSAIVAARRDQMTLAVEIAVGSSTQIALLVAPALVLASFALGTPMSLVFNSFELVAIVLSVLATSIVVLDGESNWVEGLQLLAVYGILVVAFFLIP